MVDRQLVIRSIKQWETMMSNVGQAGQQMAVYKIYANYGGSSKLPAHVTVDLWMWRDSALDLRYPGGRS